MSDTTTTDPPSMAEILEIDEIGMPATARCAQCDAQAFVEVEMPTKARIEFCAHHYKQHEPVLVLTALRIVDHRPYLRKQETSTP